MNRSDLQKLTNRRIREARALLHAGLYEGAYYLAGYAVECALKACVAKKTMRYDFPDRRLVDKVYSHDLDQLLRAAGLLQELTKAAGINPRLEVSWALVKDWNEQKRYEASIPETDARGLYRSITNKDDGVLPWLKKWW